VDKYMGRNNLSTWGGGDNFIVSNPPPAWGHTPLYGGPSPRIPPYILSECPFGGDNTLDCGNKFLGKNLSFFEYLLL